jgi:hypothetical protein
MNATSDLQKERRDRGDEFQTEIRRSWRLTPNVWRLRVPDTGAGGRPADEVVLTANGNILAELKRTKKDRFNLSFLRTNQFQGLLDFDLVLPHNYGLVFVSFNRSTVDLAYAFRLRTALGYMRKQRRNHITRRELEIETIPRIELPRIYIHGQKPEWLNGPAYDLSGVVAHCRSL